MDFLNKSALVLATSAILATSLVAGCNTTSQVNVNNEQAVAQDFDVIPVVSKDPYNAITLHNLNYQWQNVIKPETKAGIVLGEDALYAKFVVNESNPYNKQHKNFDSISSDSTCELFLSFPDSQVQGKYVGVLEKNLYINIEINSEGYCNARYAKTRKDRIQFTEAQIKALDINVTKTANDWTLTFKVPKDFLNSLTGYDVFATGNGFSYNLYKIAEAKPVEHYASYNKINSPTPNFHKPEDFRSAVVGK